MSAGPAAPALDGHVIVCGLGHAGRRCAELLAALWRPVAVVSLSAGDSLSPGRKGACP